MFLTKSQRDALTSIQRAVEGHDANETVKRTVDDKLDKVLAELARDPSALAVFFAALELSATTSAARTIATHVMRPDEVSNLVEKRKTEIANEKEKKGKGVGESQPNKR